MICTPLNEKEYQMLVAEICQTTPLGSAALPPVPVEAVVRQCIKRLNTVVRRLRYPSVCRSPRTHDAYIIETEIIPALERLANAPVHGSAAARTVQPGLGSESGG